MALAASMTRSVIAAASAMGPLDADPALARSFKHVCNLATYHCTYTLRMSLQHIICMQLAQVLPGFAVYEGSSSV